MGKKEAVALRFHAISFSFGISPENYVENRLVQNKGVVGATRLKAEVSPEKQKFKLILSVKVQWRRKYASDLNPVS